MCYYSRVCPLNYLKANKISEKFCTFAVDKRNRQIGIYKHEQD